MDRENMRIINFTEIYEKLSEKSRRFLDSDPYCEITQFTVANDTAYRYDVDPTGHYGRFDMKFSEMDDYLSQLWDKEQELLREFEESPGQKEVDSDDSCPSLDISSDDLPF